MKETEINSLNKIHSFTEENPLTLEDLKSMKHDIFATGTCLDSPSGINMSNSGKILRWIAVRGEIHDWAVYVHYESSSPEQIKQYGDKVTMESNIKFAVPCTPEAFEMYRY